MNSFALQFVVMTVAGFIQRSQQDVIEYLRQEDRVLCEQLGGRRRRRLHAHRAQDRAAGPTGIARIMSIEAGQIRRIIDGVRRYHVDRIREAQIIALAACKRDIAVAHRSHRIRAIDRVVAYFRDAATLALLEWRIDDGGIWTALVASAFSVAKRWDIAG